MAPEVTVANGTEAGEVAKPKTGRRDKLIQIEQETQTKWMDRRAYEMDPPRVELKDGKLPNSKVKKKWLVTFPYPYMNGRLHLGHAFSLTKCEFSARFRTLEGRKVLFPFAFHCTGMPICAAAQKLEKQLKEEAAEQDEQEEETAEVAAANGGNSPEDKATQDAERKAAGVFKTKKGKLAGKTSNTTQKEILLSCGVAENLIPNFTDPNYWLSYFPPYGTSDLMKFGIATDWRRSFITTDQNPYYDAFIRWQFRILKKAGYIKFGKRETIFDALNEQPCADHDRSAGEGVGPQNYTLIKMQIQSKTCDDDTDTLKKILDKAGVMLGDQAISQKVFLVAATLRPETMSGQTNCFVLPEGEYGAYQMKNDEIFVCSARSAANLCYQDHTVNVADVKEISMAAKEIIELSSTEAQYEGYTKKPLCYLKFSGKDLFGTPLTAPMATYSKVYVLPMLGISMTKGTGVVTSVPADAPDDLAALRDLQTKAKFRDEQGVKLAWCDGEKFPVVNIINIPEFGDASAVTLCEELKITSQKDKEKLKLAKDRAYLKGFTEGKMIAGPFKGKPVAEAKEETKKKLIGTGEALSYWEPESVVVARSGRECIVSFCDQWYLDYSDEHWTNKVATYLAENNQTTPVDKGPGLCQNSEFEGYHPSTRNGLIRTTHWIKQWACSRTFGLGTKLPWDEKWIIESLSDSTIYMAYYTIAHLLQGGIPSGKKPHSGPVGSPEFIPPGPLRIFPEDLTDEVFDYIFDRRQEIPADNPGNISKSTLEELRNEFQFWYPVDIRCSAKDLIQNHLTMSMFNHAAVWPEQPHYWPKSMFVNGMVNVDNEKMSKSLGNFMTLEGVCEQYSADVVRLTCADAGDTLEDANWSSEIANQTVLRFTALEEWAQKTMDDIRKAGKKSNVSYSFLDQCFENEMTQLINLAFDAYARCQYKEAVKYSWYETENLRKTYLNLVGDEGYNPESITRFLKYQAIILSPIAPHFCDHLWANIMKQSSLLAKEKWPHPEKPFNTVLHRQFEVLEKDLRTIRMGKESLVNEKKKEAAKKKLKDFDFNTQVKKAVIYVAKDYKEWQQGVLKFCQTLPLTADEKAIEESKAKTWAKDLMQTECYKALPKSTVKNVMPFASFVLREELSVRGRAALELNLPFDEMEMLACRVKLIKSQLGLEEVELRASAEGSVEWDNSEKCGNATPAKPTVAFKIEA